MKRSILLLLFLLAVLALAGLFLFFRPLWFSGAGMVLVAAPDGQGEACTLFRPCSLATAQQQARQAQPKGDLLVYLREGVYPLSETWQLEPQDSGKDRWTIYQAYPGETPVLSGGMAVTCWEEGSNPPVPPRPWRSLET